MSPVVYLVDDDPGVLKALSRGLWVAGYHVAPSSSGDDFLEIFQADEPGCVVLDLMMPEKSGTDIQDELAKRGATPAIVYISGFADITNAVRIMKGGAVDLLVKPFELDQLLDAVARAVGLDGQRRQKAVRREMARRKFALLSSREFEVLSFVLEGWSNEQISKRLGIVVKTVKVHREHVRRKLGVRSIVQLAHLATEADFWAMHMPPGDPRCKSI